MRRGGGGVRRLPKSSLAPPSAAEATPAPDSICRDINFAFNRRDLLYVLRLLGCPYKLTRSALKAPGTPHSWPPLLSVLHWLTILASVSGDATSFSPFNDLMRYTTQGYSYFILGDDGAVVSRDNEYVNKARTHAEEDVEATRALEKEAQELEEKRNKLTSGPTRREALEADKAALTEDVRKFEAVVKTWSSKVNEKEEASVNLRIGRCSWWRMTLLIGRMRKQLKRKRVGNLKSRW